MTEGVDFFVWARPVSGYQWVESKAVTWAGSQLEGLDKEETRFLVWREPDRTVYRTNLLESEPVLFRKFTEVEPTEQGFLSFANEYGGLGLAFMLNVYTEEKRAGKTIKSYSFGNPRGQGEPFWRWRKEHRQMLGVTKVLTAIQDEDFDSLGQWFRLTEEDADYACDDPKFGLGRELIFSVKLGFNLPLWTWALSTQSEASQLTRVAIAWAQKQINAAMSSSAGSDRHSLVGVRLLIDSERERPLLQIVPDTLLAAMWFQCARVLSENITFRACQSCGKWFEISPDARRRQSKYCSDRCKVRAYRNRKAKGVAAGE